MPKSDFWPQLWESFQKIHGFLGVILALGLWLVTPSDDVPLKIVVPMAVLGALGFGALFDAALTFHQETKDRLPDVIRSYPAPAGEDEAELLLLLEPSQLFSIGSLVSIYHKDPEGFEQHVGVGRVYNVQENGQVVISVLTVVDAQQEKLKRLEQNDRQALDWTLVKPFVSEESAYLPLVQQLVQGVEDLGDGIETGEVRDDF